MTDTAFVPCPVSPCSTVFTRDVGGASAMAAHLAHEHSPATLLLALVADAYLEEVRTSPPDEPEFHCPCDGPRSCHLTPHPCSFGCAEHDHAWFKANRTRLRYAEVSR